MLPHCEQRRRACAQTFFSRVNMLFYAGAALSQPVWDGCDGARRMRACGERIVMVHRAGRDRDRAAVASTAPGTTRNVAGDIGAAGARASR